MRLRDDFSDLRVHRFNHNFNCTSSITCKCRVEDESTEHYLLRCPLYVAQRTDLLSSITDIVKNDFTVLPHDFVTRIVLYGSCSFNDIANKMILESTIRYIKRTKRFEVLEAFSI